MTFEFSKAFSPKVTTPPPKPKSKIGFRTATFLVKDTPGIPGIWWIKNDIILVGFRVDNYCLLRIRSSGRWERKRSELKPSSFVRSSLTDMSATNRPILKLTFFFSIQTICNRKFPSSDTVSSQNSPGFQAMYFSGGSASLSLVAHSCFCSSKASATLARTPSELDWGADLAEK